MVNAYQHVVKRLPVVLAAASLAACAVGPDYHEPQQAPAQLRSVDAAQFTNALPAAAWWQQFTDPVLDDLESKALAASPDLRIAVAHLRASRAGFTEAELNFAPHVPLEAGYTHSKQQQPGFGTQRYNGEAYHLGFDANWELDLFGYVRRSVEAAKANVGIADANLRDAQVSLTAEVARNYFQLRGVQARIKVAQANLQNQQEALHLTQIRHDIGRGDELDVQSAKARLSATEATLPTLQSQQAQLQDRLAVLLGQRPGSLDAQLVLPQEIPTYMRPLPIGDPSAVLRQRADVRVAERGLAVATARVGVATADLFPRVRVSGFIGFLSGDLGQLFRASSDVDSRAWSIAPTVQWTALDFASTRARIHAAKADADAALATYEKAVLTALEDTNNAFSAYNEQRQRLQSLGAQADAAREAARLAGIRYREGASDFLTLLDAQRTQLAAEDELELARTGVNVGVVGIYKALGGLGDETQPAAAKTVATSAAPVAAPSGS